MRRAVVIAIALVGCAKQPAKPTITCAPPECAFDTQLALVAEVDPALNGAFVRQEFTTFTIDAKTGQFTLKLDKPVTLNGYVSVSIFGTVKAVPATLVATRPSRISGRADVYYQTTSDPAAGAYQLLVSPNIAGEEYAVRVTPNDSTSLPPLQQVVTATADGEIDFPYPDPLTMPEMHGVIRDSLLNPVPGMQVQALDPQSGLVVSTTTTTDSAGRFELRLAPGGPTTLQLLAAPMAMAMGNASKPTLTRTVTLSPPPTTGSMVEADLQLPPLPAPAHTIYAVTGTGPSGAPMPVVGATCIFTADVSDPNATDGTTASYSATATTDAMGNAAVDLIPSVDGNRAYSVTITPDASSTFQAVVTTVNVAPQGGYAQALMLPLRPLLSGRVLDPTDKPLLDVTVTPTPSKLSNASPTVMGVRAFTPTAAPAVMVDNDGRFGERLDPATWDVGLLPPPTAMLPRLWLANTPVTVDTNLGDVKLPRGVMVRGILHTPDGTPVPGADVRLFTEAPSNVNCSLGDLTCLQPARLRAEGPTDETGSVIVLLPSAPAN